MSRNTQSRLRGVKTQGKTRILGVALLAALLALVVAGCSKVTGGGQFWSQGLGEVSFGIAQELGLDPFEVDTTGDKVSFGLTGQPTGEESAKGQVTLTDKSIEFAVSAALTFTIDDSDPSLVLYEGEGTARVNQMGGPGKISQWDIVVFAYDGNNDGQPDYVEVMIWDPDSGFAVAWSGEVVNGNIVVHNK